MSETFPQGSLVKVRSGGPVMTVFYVKTKTSGAPVPKALQSNVEDSDLRSCFFFNNNNDPCLADFPASCLESAETNPY